MKKIFPFLFLLSGMVQAFCSSPSESDFGFHLQFQFKKLLAWNELCLASGKKEDRIFFFVYEPGKDIDFSQYECREDWFDYQQLPGSAEALFDEISCQYLNEQLLAFNQAGEEVENNNAEKTTVYAFFIHDFKGYIKADPEELTANNGTSILEYLQQNPERVGPEAYSSYKSFKESLNEKVKGIDFGNSENNLLIYGAGFKAYEWKEKYQRIYTVTSKSSGAFLEENEYCRKAFQDKQFSQRSYPFQFPTKSEASRRFTNAVLSQLEFLTSGDLKESCSACGPSLSQYLNELWDEKARMFLRERCPQLKDDPDRMNYAFSIAQFIQSLGFVYDDYEMNAIHPDEYNWSGQWEEYLVFETALKEHEARLHTAHQLLREAVENEDWYKVFLVLYHFNSPIIYEALSEIERVATIKVLASGPMLGSWLLGNHEQQVIHLFQYVPDDPLYIEQFLSALKNEPGLLKRLLNKIQNHWIGPDTRMKFIKALTKLIQARPTMNKVYSEHALIWDLPDQLVKGSFEYDYTFTPESLLQFDFKQCIEIDNYYTGNNFHNLHHPICIRKERFSWEPLDPFALIDIAVIDKLTVIDVCGTQGCKGQVFKDIPAVFAAYLIKQNRVDTRIEQFFTGLEVAGLAFGVGELVLAIRLGSSARLLIAGYILASDVSSIVVGSEQFKEYLILSLGQEEGKKVYEYLQLFTTINNIIAGTTGMIAIEDAAKAVSSIEKIEKIGLVVGEIEQQLGYSISNLSGKELKGLYHAMRQELESTESGKSALRSARASLGIDELAAIIQTLKLAGASEELIDKIILLPIEDVKLLLSQLTRNQNRLIPRFNESIKLVDIWYLYRKSDSWEMIRNWPEALFYSHFSDLNRGSELFEALKKHPRLTQAYEVLYGDGSPPLILYRSSPEDIKVVDEYIRAYPDKIEEFKVGYLASTDKRAYIYELLGPGKPGQRVKHRIRGLFEAIVVDYIPGGIDFFEDILISGTFNLLTRVHMVGGGKPGHYRRVWDPSSSTFTFDEGFRYDAPKWIEDVNIPLVEGKGIPTATYVALRQLKILGIPEGSLKKLKLSTVQNAEIMRDIYVVMQRNGLENLEEASDYLINEPGIQYAVTMIKQAGYDIANISIKPTNHTGYHTARYISMEKGVSEINDAWIAQNNLTWETEFFIHFNIELELTPMP